DELADGAQAAVAEVLVLVEVLGHGLTGHAHRLGRIVLDLDVALLGDAEDLGQTHELVHQGDDVVLGQGADVEVGPLLQPRVELVAPNAGEVIALGVEEKEDRLSRPRTPTVVPVPRPSRNSRMWRDLGPSGGCDYRLAEGTSWL